MYLAKNFPTIVLIVAVDQLLKILFFKSAYLNSGIAFGILSGNGTIVTSFYLLVFLGLLTFCLHKRPENIGWIILLSGVFSNLIDRVRIGAIIDPFIIGNFPAFNLADVLILCGIILIIFKKDAHKLQANSKSV